MVGDVDGSERVHAAMVDAHGVIVRSWETVAVVVKPAVVLATSPYGNDQMMEREVRYAMVVASHDQAQSSMAFHGHGDVKCRITWA